MPITEAPLPYWESRKAYTAWEPNGRMPKKRNNDGQYVKTATLEDVGAAFGAVDGPPVVTTADVADETGLSRDSARRKLERLRERDEVARRRSAGRVLYWPAEWERRSSAAESGSESAMAPESSESDSRSDEDTNGEQSAVTADEGLRKSVREYLEVNDLPPKTAHGRAAVLDVFQYLREHGPAETSAVQEAVYPEYSDEWSTSRTMWNALDRHLDLVPGVEKAGYGKWGYTGDDAVRELVQE